MWYLRYTTGPRTNTPDKAASVTADAIRTHIRNIDSDVDGDGIGNYLTRSVADSLAYIASFAAVAYAPKPVTSYAPLEEKPTAPNVCVWDKLKPAEQARVAELVGAPA